MGFIRVLQKVPIRYYENFSKNFSGYWWHSWNIHLSLIEISALAITHNCRSTPCPAAKSVDEWLEPEQCENGDDCGYCHTRTEQQFHPEIYKSTKCNDMLEHGYCPRAVFCAFAHHDSELHVQRIPYHRSSDAKSVPIPLRKSSIAESNVSPRSRAG